MQIVFHLLWQCLFYEYDHVVMLAAVMPSQVGLLIAIHDSEHKLLCFIQLPFLMVGNERVPGQ